MEDSLQAEGPTVENLFAKMNDLKREIEKMRKTSAGVTDVKYG